MTSFFAKIDRLKPIYDWTEKGIMLLCKILLITDVLITSMAVLGRYIPFVPDPAWSEEIVLTCMVYMAVLSAAIALRHNRHIRMTAFDKWLPRRALLSLELLADFAVSAFAIVMIVYGYRFITGPLARGSYTSMPGLSKFWMYFPVFLAGVAMIIFEIELIYNHIKAFFIEEVKV